MSLKVVECCAALGHFVVCPAKLVTMLPCLCFVYLLSFCFVFMQVNDTVTFKLLRRSRDSIIPAEVHPSPDPSMIPGQDTDQSGIEVSQTTWGTDRGHKESSSTVSNTGGTVIIGDKAKEAKHHNKNKQATKESEEYGGRGFNKYAKFTRVGDGKAFWKAAAQELASYAAQVVKHVVLRCPVLCHAGLCCAALCSAVLCCAVPCHAVPCCAAPTCPHAVLCCNAVL